MTNYDPELIQKNIKKLRELDRCPAIAWDCDNTLFRFSIKGKENFYLEQSYTKGFYRELPIFKEAPAVLENLRRMGIDQYIVTSSLPSPFCKSEKEEAINYHFPMIPNTNIFILDPGVPKESVFTDISDIILVDDYGENVHSWYKHGGVAIKKSYSGKKRPVPTIQSLVDIFGLLYYFNVLGRL